MRGGESQGPMNLAPAMTELHPKPDLSAVWAALEALTDPEIPVVTLRELGILREVRRGDDGGVEVVITPTYSGCPAMAQIEDDIRSTLAALGLPVRVVTQLAPAWTTDWITEAAREKLRQYGIAPPSACTPPAAAGERVLRFATRASAEPVPCPRCGSMQTSELAHFGSTACKSQWRCLDCLEPFDYFKPY
jgi:ring-1,2-phenylacetyl-CoA epoxidase subunit PaaD